ncbi:MAG: LptF/LptG family permease [Opitutaceae bacterium]
MNILDRHIFKSAFFTCFAAVALFVFMLVAGNIVRDLLGPGLSGQISMEATGRLILLLIPLGITYGLPMGMLTGVLLTLGRLSADSEITAMRTCGISLPRIAFPLIVLGVLGAAVGVPVNFESMPRARTQYDRELSAALRADPIGLVAPRVFIRDFPGFVAYVSAKKGSELEDVWLWQLDTDRRVTRFVHAATGHLTYDEARNELILTLTQAHVETRNEKDPEDFSEANPIAYFGKVEPTRLSLERIFGRVGPRQKLAWMTYGELRAEQTRLASEKVAPADAKEHAGAQMKVAMTIQDKFNTALAAFSFVIVGIPLGIKVSRRETSANLGVAVVLALGYYFLTVMVGWLDRHPEYRPDLLLWAPNLIIMGVGIWLFSRIDRA